MKKEIMFLCTGNTCRSPMAEGIAKEILDDEMVICSRGIAVHHEESAHNNAIHIMKDRGIDISNHRAKGFNKEEVTANMLILTMTFRHKAYLLDHYPDISDQVYTLLEYVGDQGNVADPYGQNIEVYKACADQLEVLIRRVADKGLM